MQQSHLIAIYFTGSGYDKDSNAADILRSGFCGKTYKIDWNCATSDRLIVRGLKAFKHKSAMHVELFKNLLRSWNDPNWICEPSKMSHLEQMMPVSLKRR